MSIAWQVTDDDIKIVLTRHGLHSKKTFDKASAYVEAEADRIESAALAYNDMGNQADSALDEIENILIEENIIKDDKKFSAPDNNDDDDEENDEDEDEDED